MYIDGKIMDIIPELFHICLHVSLIWFITISFIRKKNTLFPWNAGDIDNMLVTDLFYNFLNIFLV